MDNDKRLIDIKDSTFSSWVTIDVRAIDKEEGSGSSIWTSWLRHTHQPTLSIGLRVNEWGTSSSTLASILNEEHTSTVCLIAIQNTACEIVGAAWAIHYTSAERIDVDICVALVY